MAVVQLPMQGVIQLYFAVVSSTLFRDKTATRQLRRVDWISVSTTCSLKFDQGVSRRFKTMFHPLGIITLRHQLIDSKVSKRFGCIAGRLATAV